MQVAYRLARRICGASALCLFLTPAAAHGEEKDNALPPNRTEFIPVPNIGGNSDTGVDIGVAGSFVRFREGYYPYRFRLDAVISTSFKIDDRGFRFVQQYHTIRLDHPEFISKKVRFDARVDFLRNVDATWFGVGNATMIAPRPAPPDASSAYDYVARHVRTMAFARIKTDTVIEAAVMSHTRYVFPDPYTPSKLTEDLRSGAIIGGDPALLQSFGAGIVVDKRDNEFFPRRGLFYLIGLAGTVGNREDVRFGEASATLTHYVSLSPAFVFANRLIGSLKVGNVPFYELQQGGVFDPQYLVGGSGGVRGVRLGRYAGLVKAIANTDLRMSPLPRFHVFKWNVLLGATVFVDAGRVWSDYSFHAPADGSGLGIKYGAGAGLFFQWDEANIFRVDAAYSPDEESARSFPVSFYFESGFHF